SIADADDVELLLEALGDADHGIRHEAAREPVKLAELRVLAHGLRQQLAALHAELHAWRHALLEGALRSLDLDDLGLDADGHALGPCDTFLAYSRHLLLLRSPGPHPRLALAHRRAWSARGSRYLNYQTLQSTSPPTPAFTASRPVITPRDVVRMLVPRPPMT